MGNNEQPCILRLSPQFDRQSKFWCPKETIRYQPCFAANKNKYSAQVPLASTCS